MQKPELKRKNTLGSGAIIMDSIKPGQKKEYNDIVTVYDTEYRKHHNSEVNLEDIDVEIPDLLNNIDKIEQRFEFSTIELQKE
jgi:hypothetical protein